MLKLCIEIKFNDGEILCYSVGNINGIETCRRKALRFLNFCKVEVTNSIPIDKIVSTLDSIDLEEGIVKYCDEYTIEIIVRKKGKSNGKDT